MVSKEAIRDWFAMLQENICGALEETDGKAKFVNDRWERSGGGGGISRVITEGNIIEKGGVNFSAVWGKTPEAVLRSMKISTHDQPEFFATGISIVLHPYNPMVPIIHMNTRYFEMSNGNWWFGGGIDLTPHYVIPGDARYFHRELRRVCDNHHSAYYPEFKKWADDYFFIRHRNETRGVGGIFFDYLKDNDGFTRDARFRFVQDVGAAFAPLYIHFMKQNSAHPFGDKEKQWQYLRRGRYVEFNLVWDRGTKFGLDTDGRTESILMSLPPEAQWKYNHQPEPDSPEAQTLALLRKGVDWIEMSV
ncbi:MAG TPA: oxygen-dependent coproporphyrinogen oxidase [Ohtaekwangia sp.]|nr:oxygen-dependent coproporphyrinogen oxidase [Ohtaekwangia sp.]